MEFLTDFSADTHLPVGIIALRLAMAGILGALIGIEREWRQRPAGLRTHMLTSLAAAVFTILTIEIMRSEFLRSETAQADPIRVIEAVTSGVAFLAAGAIIQSRGLVKGLTTGAGMWLAGALGVAAGLGHFLIGIVAALLGLFIVVALGWVERGAQAPRDETPT